MRSKSLLSKSIPADTDVDKKEEALKEEIPLSEEQIAEWVKLQNAYNEAKTWSNKDHSKEEIEAANQKMEEIRTKMASNPEGQAQMLEYMG